MENENEKKSEVNLEVTVTVNDVLSSDAVSKDIQQKKSENISVVSDSLKNESANKYVRKEYVPGSRTKTYYKQRQKRFCRFCAQGIYYVDYKEEKELKKYLNQYGKIMPRHYTGCCSKHQNYLTNAIKRARIMGLLPFVGE